MTNPFKNIPGYVGIADSLSDNDSRLETFYKQYQERGFDDTQTWNLDYVISRFIYPRLVRFKEVNIGRPAWLTEEEYDNILDKMIECFRLKSTDTLSYTDEEKASIEDGWKLFGEYFHHLWW